MPEELRLDELDRDGALREALAAVSSRASFLRNGLIGSAALLGALAASLVLGQEALRVWAQRLVLVRLLQVRVFHVVAVDAQRRGRFG